MIENRRVNNFFQVSSSFNNNIQLQTSNSNNINKAKHKKNSIDNNLNKNNNFVIPEKPLLSSTNMNNINNTNNQIFSSIIKEGEKHKEKNQKGKIKNNSMYVINEEYNLNNQNNNKYIDENSNMIANRIKNKHSNVKNINVNENKYKSSKEMKNKDNNTKVFDDSLEDGFENLHVNNEDIEELKESISIKKSSNFKNKNIIYNSQIIMNNKDDNINFVSQKLKNSCCNIDNNEPYNNNLRNNYNFENDNEEKSKNRNLSCKVKKKKKINITNLKYAQDISLEKDKIILFENGLGVNDCFLNAIIQSLFHLEEFKNKLFQLKIGKDPKNPIFQLYTIFKNYEYLSKLNTIDTLNASLLRESLHCKFGTYPKGKCGDPMETISEILELIHNQYFQTNLNESDKNNKNFCQNELCPSHSNFLIHLKEMKYCPNCKIKSLQLYDKDCFMYDVLSFEVLSTVKNESFYEYKYSLFNKLKQLSQSFGDNKIRLEKCKCEEINTKKKLYLYNRFPPYLIINITWDTNFPKMGDICKIYGLIPPYDNSKNLFGIDLEKGKKTEKDLVTNYFLCSMILYGQKHYTSFFYNKAVDMWSFVDDENKRNFNTYNELIKFLIIRRSIPVGIIFYHLNDFNLDNTEKLLLNEEEFNKIYQKSIANDQRDLEEKEKMEKDNTNQNNNAFLKHSTRQNDNNGRINNNNDYIFESRNIENRNNYYKNYSIDFENMGNDKVVKIKRNKKKNIS